MRLFVFGYGFSGAALGRRLGAQGWSVAGTSRSAETRAAMAAQGWRRSTPRTRTR
jgi:predicted dinucleotide-binding enzyme